MKRYSLRMVSLIVIFSFIALELFSQTFTEQTGIVLPGIANGTALWGDADNDGDIDILISGYDATNAVIVRLYRNNGSNVYADAGSIFSPALPSAFGNYTMSAQLVDFDNDGFLDILINTINSTGSNNLLVYRHEADNSYLLKTTIDFWAWQGNSIDCGDYDNDGDQDILLITQNAARIFQNQGAFSFKEQYTIKMDGLVESSSEFVDYDNDGDLDIYIMGFPDASYNPTFRLYENTGNNSFTLVNGTNLIGFFDGSADWGDYNNDGFPDLLLTGKYDNSRIFKNNGDKTFTMQSAISLLAVTEGSGKWGDLDNDGDLDIIISGQNNNLNFTRAYINNGNNTFTELAGLTITGVFKSSIDLFDYDNDRDLDILISGNNGSSKICKVYKNLSPVNNPVPAAPTGLTTETIGNDIILRWSPVTTDNTASGSMSYNIMVGTSSGAINIVSPNSATDGTHRISGMGNAQLGTSFVLRNLPRGVTFYWKVQAIDNSWKGGTFASGPNFTYTSLIQASALNVPVRDGASATLSWTRGNGTNCAVFLKEANSGTALPTNGMTYTGSSVFKSGSQIGTTGWYCVYNGVSTNVSVTNLKPVTDYIFHVIEYSGTTYDPSSSTENPLSFTTGSFTEIKSANLAPVGMVNWNRQSSNYWIDIDNDAGNDLDLVLQGPTGTKIYRNDGANIFTLLPTSLNPTQAIAPGDYNNDGLTDIALGFNPTKLFRNTGGGTFVEETGLLPGISENAAMDWGDYNNDGKPDILICGDSFEGKSSKVFKNNGDNTFTEQQSFSLVGMAYGSAKWVDYNNDGFLDFSIAGVTNASDYFTKIYRNTGNNGFIEESNISLTGTSSSSLDWGDFDNDGDPDLIVTGDNLFTHITKIYRNDGNNVFTELLSTGLPIVTYGSAKWGDYDADGDLDILITGFTGFYTSPVTKIFKNNGDGTFEEDITCVFPGLGDSQGSWGDYDKDGDLDIILTGNTPDASFSKIYRNDIGVTNAAPAPPTGLTSTVDKSDVTLKWKSVRSDNTPYKAMTYNMKVGTTSGAINILSPNSASNGLRRVVTAGNMEHDTTFLFKKMAFGTYYWSVQAVDNGFTGSAFSAEGSFTVSPVQAKSLSAKIIDNTSLRLKWERGNGDRCAVFAKQTSTGVAVPVNNTGYVADPEYGFGGQIGSTGWYCVYNGRADSVDVTGLVNNKLYSFHIIEYMGTFGAEQYFTQVSDGNPGVFSTSIFTEQTGITLNSGLNNKVVWGDYDNDGFVDILIPGNPASRIYRNDGNNNFVEKTGIILPPVDYGGADWGDYDNDGDLDIIITGAGNSYPVANPVTKIYRNDGADIFTEQTSIILPQLLYSAVAWGDYDNDGDLDIVITGAYGTDPNYIPVSKIFDNNGNGTFSEQTQIALTPLLKGSVKWVDYDNDGDLDLVMTGATEYLTSLEGVNIIYKNNGNKTFTEQTDIIYGGRAFSTTTWGDYDNDGDLDMIITMHGWMGLYENRGNNSLVQIMYVSLPYQGACSAAWGDYDNDGYLDIILSNPGLDTKIYRNTHGLSVPGAIHQWFNKQDDDAVKSIGYSFVTWIDYDNDGDLDFLMSKDSGLPTKIFKNNLIMKSGMFKTNSVPEAPTGLKSVNSASGVKLSWKPVENDETPSKTMTYNVRIGTSKNSFNISPSQSSSSGYRQIATIGNAQLDTSYLMLNMPAIKYYWSVQAVDQGLKGGAWSPTDSVEVKNVLSFFSADTVCLGVETTFTNQAVAFGEVIQSYKWIFGDGTTSTLINPTHLFSTSGIKNVSLITFSTSTSDTLTKQVLVKANPILDFSASIACQGSETILQNISDVSGLTITSWSWDYGDGKGSTSQNPGTHGYLTSGDYQLTLSANADNLCSSSITKTVSVGAIPVASISATTPLSFCAGGSVTLSVAKTPGYIYKWSSGGVYWSGQDSSKFVVRDPGNYIAEVINPTGNCKSVSSAATVTVLSAPSAPSILASGPTVICQSDSVKLSVTNTTGYSFEWRLNGGKVADGSEYYAKNSGSYNLVVADPNGCSVTASVPVVVTANPLPTGGTIIPGGATTFCEGGNVTLSVTQNNNYTYSWYNEMGALNETSNLYTATVSGKYRLDIKTSLGCVLKSNEITVTVKPMPLLPVITPSNYSADQCPFKSKVKLSTGVGTGYNYQWFRNGTIYPNGTKAFIEDYLPQSEYLPQGDYTVEADLNGCKTVSPTFSVTYLTAPEIPEVYVRGPVVWYLAADNNTYKHYRWYLNDELIPEATKYIYVANKKLGSYRVEVANENLCFTPSAEKIIPTTKSGMTNFNIPAEYMQGEQYDNFETLKIFPNPTSGVITFEMENELLGDLKITLLTFDGKEVLKKTGFKISSYFYDKIDLSGLPKGNYLIKFDLNNIITVRKIILE